MANKINILEKIDWDVLNTYIDNGKIRINKHPDYDIWILNYAQIVQFANEWDDYTLSCRGLVIDIEGNILARPFQKFKNIEEHDLSEFDLTQEYEIFEKMDGSLIVLFYYDEEDEWIFASRGSFISEQAVEAKKIFQKKHSNQFYFLDKSKTYLFEIIY